MLINLPEKYCFNENECYASIDSKGILKVKGNYSFRNLMYDITFKTKEKKCIYCGSEKHITLDHLYPKSRGGPTIPNNMEPACKHCNGEKDNMNQKEYEFFKSLSEDDQKRFKADVKKADNIMEKWDFNFQSMPDEWFEIQKMENIKIPTTRNEKAHKNITKYSKIKKTYKSQRYFKEFVVLDRNNFLLYGLETYLCAKSLGLKEITVIKIENIEIVF